MGMFDMTMSEEQTQQFRTMLTDAVRDRTGGEELIAAGAMRRGGASGSFVASKAGGGLAYAAVSLARKKKAGGLPQQVLLALTPDNLYVFKLKLRGRSYLAKDEVAVWQRAGLRISTSQKMGLTNLTIESPAEGEKVTLVPIGVKDDEVNLELIRMLEAAHPSPVAG
jgi:hypothetical protein